MNLSEFVLARVAEDEAARPRIDTGYDRCASTEERDECMAEAAAWRRRWTAECEAKRRIVEWHSDVDGPHSCPSGLSRWTADEKWIGCPELLALAAVYSDHPDHDPDWRP